MDPNFGEVVFPLKLLPLPSTRDKERVNLTSLGISMEPRFPGDGMAAFAISQLKKDKSSLKGWSTPTPFTKPESTLVDDFAVSPADPRLAKFGAWFNFYLRKSGYLERYDKCQVRYFL